MAKESVWQRRARKCRSAKADYYPKVNLAEPANEAGDDLAALDALELPETAPPVAPEMALPAEPETDPPVVAEMTALAEPEMAPPVAAELASDPDAPLRLPDFLDLSAAKSLAQTLLERRGAPIVLDGSSVKQLGAQCVQVLLSAKRTWDAEGVALSFVNCAPRMIEDLQLLGIDSTALLSGEQSQ